MKVSQAYGVSSDFYAELQPFERVIDKYYYIEETVNLNWFGAVHKCRELGGDLVNFQNDAELNAVLSKLNKKTAIGLI